MVFSNNLLLGAVSAAADAYLIEQSLLFDGSTTYLNRTPSTAGNRKTWTFSVWFKLSTFGINNIFFNAETDTNNFAAFFVGTTNRLTFYYVVGGVPVRLDTAMDNIGVMRDPNAWYHAVIAVDTTETLTADRVKMWVNGVSQSIAIATDTLPQNSDYLVNAVTPHYIGYALATASADCLMALPILVDGATLDPTSFGEEDDDGFWNPIEFTGANTLDYVNFSEGTVGGTMTSGGGNAAAFNGETIETSATAAAGATTGCYVSKQWSTAKTITGCAVWGVTTSGHYGSGTGTLKVEGSNTGAWSGEEVTLGTKTSVNFAVSNSVNYFSSSDLTTTTGYTYHRVYIERDGGGIGNVYIAEVQFYEDSTTAGYGTNGFTLDFNNSSFFGQDVKQEFTAPSVAFTDSAYDTTNTTSYTFSSMDIGVADDDRYVYACVGSSRLGGGPLSFQTVTIGGVSATLLAASNSDLGPNTNQPYAIYVAKVSSGTTVDVVVTLNSSPANCAVALYRAVGVGLGYVDLKSSNGSTSPHSVTVDVPANGFILAHGCKNVETNRVTFTGVTEQYDFGGENDMAIYGGLNTAAGGTSQTVTVATTSPSYFGLLAVTIPPTGDNSYAQNNFTASDQLPDTPTDSTDNETGNWMTMSPINTNTNVTFSEGNMRLVGSGGDKRTSISSMILPSTGKFYFEAYWNSYAGDSGIGFMDTNVMHTSTWRTDANGQPGGVINTDGYAINDGPNYYVDGGGAVSLTSPSTTNYQQLAIDMDTGEVWYGINNTWLNSGNPAAGTGEVGTFDAANLANGLFFVTSLRSGADVTLNFGQRAFNYTPPTGFTGLSNTANYPDPTIAKPSDYAHTQIVTHNGTSTDFTINWSAGSFDTLFIIKNVDASEGAYWVDTLSGITKVRRTTNAGNPTTDANVISVSGTTATLGSTLLANRYSVTAIKAGASGGASNTDGSITTTISRNSASGFGIMNLDANGGGWFFRSWCRCKP